MPGFGIQGGYVYRGIDNFRVLANANRPMSAYNVPITIRDPGVDGVLGNADDGAGIPGFNLSAAAIAAGVRNLTTNLPGNAEYHTLEFSANKRQTGRWSLQGSFAMRWNQDQETGYFGNNLRVADDAVNAERSHQHRDGGRYEFTMWTAKVNGSYRRRVGHPPHAGAASPAGPAVRPDVPGRRGQRHQLRHAAHPRRAHRLAAAGRHRHSRPPRREVLQPAGSRRIAVFSDIYNITNSDAAQNITWNSGSRICVRSIDHRTAHHARSA